MNRKILLRCLELLLCFFVLAACNKPELASPTSTVTTATAVSTEATAATEEQLPQIQPLLNDGEISGHFIVDADFTLYNIVVDPITKNISQNQLAKNALFSSVSPDHTYLLYFSQQESQINLYDFKTGKTHTLSEDHGVSCLSWSPSSKQFSAVVDDKLVVYNVDGSSIQIPYTPPSATYNTVNGVGEGTTYYGHFDCGVWISPDKFIFQRVASMPNKLEDEIYDTSTLVDLSSSTPKLTDAKQRWFVVDACPQKDLALIGDKNNQIYLTKSFDTFDTANFTPVGITLLSMNSDLMYKRNLGFIPESDCTMYFQTLDLGFHPGRVDILSPDKLGQPEEFTVNGTMYITNWQGAWVGNAGDKKIAVLESGEYTSAGINLEVIDLTTGDEKLLCNIPEPDGSILAWLP